MAASTLSPVDIVQRQLDAYNAHDLDAFCACFADDVRTWRMPDTSPALAGKPALRAFYAEQRFAIPTLRAELLARVALGDKVIDHERVHGLHPQPSEVAAVYRVADGLIAEVWFFAP
jgi:hypothetical protein